jgi:hypothetical protein
MTVNFSSTIVRKFYQKAVRKTDYGVLYIDDDLRKSVGSRVDALLIAAEETGESLNWDELMNNSRTVCELLIP